MRKMKKQVLLLAAIAVAMFAFSFALVPLYDMMCRVLGINGKTSLLATKNRSYIDKSRLVTMQFLANHNERIDWDFYPDQKQITLHPGADVRVTYFARNNTDKTMTVQAVPSVTPAAAANHLHKTECFCFRQTTLKAHQSMHMPIIFHFDNQLPAKIQEVTMSYSLFIVKKKS